jgi:DNA topoisomerase VI subunit A
MSAADDIKKGLTKNLANFTKQRKAEEKHISAGRWRMSRITQVRGMYLIEAANKVMAECYMKASDNNRLPATARQIYYVARPLIEAQTDKPLSYSYFSQTLLPDFVNKHGAGWDVVYDDRGHFAEPHIERVIGLGTLNVRGYLSRIDKPKFDEADFDPASVKTYGPDGSFGAVLYVEKEGFLPLFERVKLAKRFDIAIMSSKGMSVTAARELVDKVCRRIPLLVLHDFDSAGIIIRDTLENDTRRYSYSSPPRIIDLGLHYGDIGGLPSEPNNSTISDERLSQAGLDHAAIDFLRTQRVELNAMTSRQLVDFVEAKLQQHGIRKVIPNSETLAKTYQMFAASDRLSEAFDKVKEELEDEPEAQIKVPDDLEAQVNAKLQEKPDITWHRAVRLILDPDAVNDDDEEKDDETDDQDLSDIDE